MRVPILLIAAALPVLECHAEPLTAADREALLEKLEELRNNAQERTDSKYRVALTAYRSAMASNDGALTLYLKCIEKLNFTDRERKPADFRDWKRREGDRLSDTAFAVALRHQLRWLVLTLQSASPKADRIALAADAAAALDDLFRDCDNLRQHRDTLDQAVLGTVFARAYDLGRVEAGNWPASPLQIEQVYEQVLLPPVRSAATLDSLRSAWIRRIHQEGRKVDAFDQVGRNGKRGGDGGGKRGEDEGDAAASARFELETRPGLVWRMEVDLYRNGDQQGAALRMLQHIETNLAHRSARQWGEEFRALLNPQEPPAETATAEEL